MCSSGGTSALVLFVVVFVDDFDGNDDDDAVFGSFSPSADLESRGGFSVPA